MSPDGDHLFAQVNGPNFTYQIVQFNRDKVDDTWIYVGEITSRLDRPELEEMYNPFVTPDYKYIYFGAYDRDRVEPGGIYRAAILWE